MIVGKTKVKTCWHHCQRSVKPTTFYKTLRVTSLQVHPVHRLRRQVLRIRVAQARITAPVPKTYLVRPKIQQPKISQSLIQTLKNLQALKISKLSLKTIKYREDLAWIEKCLQTLIILHFQDKFIILECQLHLSIMSLRTVLALLQTLNHIQHRDEFYQTEFLTVPWIPDSLLSTYFQTDEVSRLEIIQVILFAHRRPVPAQETSFNQILNSTNIELWWLKRVTPPILGL